MLSSFSNVHGVFRYSLKDSLKSLKLTPKKESLIMLHFSSKGRRFKKSTGYKCSLKDWDSEKQRIRTGKGMKSNAYQVNTYLNQILSYSQDELSIMLNKNNSIDLEKLSESINNKIVGVCDKVDESDNEKLIHYANQLMESKKDRVKITTCRSCYQTIDKLILYQERENTVLKFDDINLTFYHKFVSFLERENYSLNSIGKHVKNLKTILNDALINGVSKNTVFKNRSFKVLKETTTDIYLTIEELEILASIDLSMRPKVQLARDIFLIGCYTGQRVSDYNGLTTENIDVLDGHKFIKIIQKKTNTIVHIPITSKIAIIMNRYNKNFPKKMSEPILRKNIKTACYLAGFKGLVNVSFTKGGEIIKDKVPKYKLVKTHTARRSFCTNYYKEGKPIQSIMLFSGHKTEKEFYNYIRIEKQQQALSLLQNGFFN